MRISRAVLQRFGAETIRAMLRSPGLAEAPSNAVPTSHSPHSEQRGEMRLSRSGVITPVGRSMVSTTPHARQEMTTRPSGLWNAMRVARCQPSGAPAMFAVTEEDETAIRTVYEQRGEFAAGIELRRRFPGITDNAQARERARTIADWRPLPPRPVKRMPEVPRLRRVR
jgi:hypothetical protein